MLRRSYTRFASILFSNGIFLIAGSLNGALPEIIDNPLPLAQSGEAYTGDLETFDEDGDFVRVVPTLLPPWLELSRCLDSIDDHADSIGGLSGVVDVVADGENMYALQPTAIQKIDADGQSISELTDFSSLEWGTGHSIISGFDGFLYVTDVDSHQVVRVNKDTGVATVFAGRSGTIGFQDGSRLDALFFAPTGLVFDVAGNLYVAEKFGNRIRKISPSGDVSTLSISGFSQPMEMDMDADGNIWVANYLSNQILKLNPSDEEVLQIIGTGQVGSQDGEAEVASFTLPSGLGVDASGFVWVTCADGNVRKVSPAGLVSTLEWEGDDFQDLRGVGKDPNGSVCLTDFASDTLYGLMFEYKLVGTPEVEHAGDSVLSFLIYDGTGNIGTYQTSVSVNVPPVLTSASSAVATEDQHFELVITATDENQDVPVISAVELPGWLSFHNENTLQGTPLEADIGNHVATMRLSDGRGGEAIVEISFEVLIGNLSPEFTSSSSVNAPEDQPFVFQVTATDPDEGDVLTIEANNLPGWLTMTDVSNGVVSLEGSPVQANVGQHIFVLSVTDVLGLSVTKTLVINVTNVNDAPVWAADTEHQLVEDTLFEYTVNAQDEDIGDQLTISAVTIPEWLSVTDGGNGSAVLSGIPLNEHVGETTIQLKVVDLSDAESSVFIDLSVENTNDAPSFLSESIYNVNEDSNFSFTVEALDVDLDDSITLTAINLPSWLTFTDNQDGTGLLSGSPVNDDVGEHSFQLKAEDLSDASVTVTHTAHVINVNDAPFFSSGSSHSLTEDVEYSFTVEALDVDPGDSLTITAINLPAWLSLQDNENGTAELSGLPTNDHVGEHSFQLKVEDEAESSEVVVHSLMVENVNDAPVFNSPTTYQLVEDTEFDIMITATDLDVGDSLSLSIPNLPDWLSFQDNGDGTASLTGLPLNDHVGDHSIQAIVKDTEDAEVQLDFTLSVSNTNDLPFVVSDLSLTLTEDEEFQFKIRTDDVDVGDQLSITTVNIPEWLTFQDIGNGTANLSGTPLNDHVGNDTWSFLVADSTNASVQFDLSIEVLNTNDSVSWVSQPPDGSFQENSLYRYDMEATDPDIGDQLTISPVTLPDWLTFTDHGDGTATLQGVTPVSTIRNYQFEMIVADQDGSQAAQTVQIEVPINGDFVPEIVMPGRVTLNFDSGYFDTVFTVKNESNLVFYENLVFTLSNLPDHFSVPPEAPTDDDGNILVTIPLLKPGEVIDVSIELSSPLREPDDVTLTSSYHFDAGIVPFAELTPLAASFYESSWFGVINAEEFPWIWHESLGWMYLGAAKPDQLWLYHDHHEWLYFSSDTFPYFLDTDPEGWLYLNSGESPNEFNVFDYRTMRYIDW